MQTIAGPALIAPSISSTPAENLQPIHQDTQQTSSVLSPSPTGEHEGFITHLRFGKPKNPAPPQLVVANPQPTQPETTPGSVLIPLSDALARIPLPLDEPDQTPDAVIKSVPGQTTGSNNEPETGPNPEKTSLPGLSTLYEALSKLEKAASDTDARDAIAPIATAETITEHISPTPATGAESATPTASPLPPGQLATFKTGADTPTQPKPPSDLPARPTGIQTPIQQSATTDTGADNAISTAPSSATPAHTPTTIQPNISASDTSKPTPTTAAVDTPEPIPAAEQHTTPTATPSSARPVSAALPVVEHTSSAAAPTESGRPAQHVSYIEQVSAKFIDSFNGRIQRFEIRLDPPELGQVDVSIEIGTDQKIRAVLATSETASLLELMRGARALEGELARAGIDLADDRALTFRLNRDGSEHGTHRHNSNDGHPADQTAEQQTPDSQDDQIQQDDPVGDLTLIRRSRTDMHV